jgi:isoleucyl-tRNA synthetase
MYYLIEMLVRWLTPIIPFTADELWSFIPGEREESVFTVHWYSDFPADLKDEHLTNECWRELMRVRDEVNKALERARNEGKIGSGLDANVILYADHAHYPRLELLKDELRFLLITSGATLAPIDQRSPASVLSDLEGLAIEVQATTAQKCARCWQRREDVGTHPAHPELCGRCVVNVEGEGEVRFYA